MLPGLMPVRDFDMDQSGIGCIRAKLRSHYQDAIM